MKKILVNNRRTLKLKLTIFIVKCNLKIERNTMKLKSKNILYE